MPVEQDDPEREKYDPGPAEDEIYDGLTLATFVHYPQGSQDERIELDGEACREARPPSNRRGRRREPYRRDGGDDYVVGVVVGRVDGVGEGGPGEDEGGSPLFSREPVAHNEQRHSPCDEREER